MNGAQYVPETSFSLSVMRGNGGPWAPQNNF